MTDMDLPRCDRTQANMWEADYFQLLHTIRGAHKGIHRLQGKLKKAKLRIGGLCEQLAKVTAERDELERALARYQQAGRELPEEPGVVVDYRMVLRTHDFSDMTKSHYRAEKYAEVIDYIDALRAYAARLAAELAASRRHPQLSRGLSNHGADYTALIESVRKIDPDAAEYMAGPAHKLSGFSPQKHLDAAFIWSKTPQGLDYWEQINGLLYIQLTESAAAQSSTVESFAAPSNKGVGQGDTTPSAGTEGG